MVERIIPGSEEEWRKFWDDATSRDKPDIQTERLLLQFRAQIRSVTCDTYLCVRSDGTVCINGKKDDLNTMFKVIHLYPLGYYQIICDGEPCQNQILYVQDGKLQSRRYNSREDSVDTCNPDELPQETLFTMDQKGNLREAALKSIMGPYTLVYLTMNGDQNYKVSLESEIDGPSDDRLIFEVNFAKKETAV